MSGLNLEELKFELSKLINSTEYLSLKGSEEKIKYLYALVDKASVDTVGDVTVLYSGNIDGASSNNIVKSIKDISIIDNTAAAEFLSSDEFMKAYAETKGYDVKELRNAPRDSEIGKFRGQLYHGTDGPWATTSKRFVEATTGEVRIISSLDANKNGVFALTEMEALKSNT